MTNIILEGNLPKGDKSAILQNPISLHVNGLNGNAAVLTLAEAEPLSMSPSFVELPMHTALREALEWLPKHIKSHVETGPDLKLREFLPLLISGDEKLLAALKSQTPDSTFLNRSINILLFQGGNSSATVTIGNLILLFAPEQFAEDLLTAFDHKNITEAFLLKFGTLAINDSFKETHILRISPYVSSDAIFQRLVMNLDNLEAKNPVALIKHPSIVANAGVNDSTRYLLRMWDKAENNIASPILPVFLHSQTVSTRSPFAPFVENRNQDYSNQGLGNYPCLISLTIPLLQALRGSGINSNTTIHFSSELTLGLFDLAEDIRPGKLQISSQIFSRNLPTHQYATIAKLLVDRFNDITFFTDEAYLRDRNFTPKKISFLDILNNTDKKYDELAKENFVVEIIRAIKNNILEAVTDEETLTVEEQLLQANGTRTVKSNNNFNSILLDNILDSSFGKYATEFLDSTPEFNPTYLNLKKIMDCNSVTAETKEALSKVLCARVQFEATQSTKYTLLDHTTIFNALFSQDEYAEEGLNLIYSIAALQIPEIIEVVADNSFSIPSLQEKRANILTITPSIKQLSFTTLEKILGKYEAPWVEFLKQRGKDLAELQKSAINDYLLGELFFEAHEELRKYI